MAHDFRLALRTLTRNPAFTAIAVLSLALGIGANTAIFSLLDQVLLRLLPVKDPKTLVVLHAPGRFQGASISDNGETVFSYPFYRDLRERSEAFDGVIARTSRVVALGYEGSSERGRAELVSGNFFGVLDLQPVLGRVFSEDEDAAPGAHPVAVLTYPFWIRQFGGSPAAIGKTVRINGNPFTVIGVLPDGFYGVQRGQIPDVMAPLAMQRQVAPQWDGFNQRRIAYLNIFARLKPGAGLPQAEAATQAVFRNIRMDELAAMDNPPARVRDALLSQKVELRPAGQGINEMRSEWQGSLTALMAMVGLVLLIACANVANLLIAKGTARRREIAIRLSLGATRLRIVRQLLVESLLLALAAGVAGLTLASWITDFLVRTLPDSAVTPGFLEFQLDSRVLAFTFLLSLVTAVLFGLLPAAQNSRAGISATLKGQSGAVTPGSGHARLRKGMLLAQLSLATLLLVEAGLFARTLNNLLAADAGFRTENLMTFSLDPRLNGYDDARASRFLTDLQERLAAIPGVTGVGAANPGPLTESGRSGSITVEGHSADSDKGENCSRHGVSAGYFRMMGIPIVAGREFTAKDGREAPKAAVVNEAFAKHYFGSENPLGRRLVFSRGNVTPDIEIVGVARNYKHTDLRQQPPPAVFVPLAQDKYDGATIYLRTAAGEAEAARRIRAAVGGLDSSVSLFNMKSMRMEVSDAVYRERLIALLACWFGALATLLAALGVYGVIAFMVARRTNEIGLRVALGAMHGDVLWLVMKEVMALAAAGISAGLVLAYLAAALVESQMFGVNARDPFMLAGAGILLALVALAAAFVPARRAARINPLQALRYE